MTIPGSTTTSMLSCFVSAAGRTAAIAALDRVGKIYVADLEPQLAADDAGHVEHVFDNSELRLGVSLDDLQRPLELCARGLLQPDGRPAEDGVQRRSQFVRDVAQKLILRAIRNFRVVTRSALALEESGEPRQRVVSLPRSRAPLARAAAASRW